MTIKAIAGKTGSLSAHCYLRHQLEFQEESVHFMAIIAFSPGLQDTDYC